MSAIRVPSLGPIIGHTTAHSCRVWLRGHESEDNRTIGIAILQKDGLSLPETAQYVRLKREHDRTGVADFTGLTPDSAYRVFVGSLSLNTDDPFEVNTDDEVWSSLPPPASWKEQLEMLDRETASGTFKTFPDGVVETLSFVFGSCRYPGLLWMKKRADQIFLKIHEHMHQKPGEAPRFFMMVGDQIYADVLPKAFGVSVADTEEEFRDRYLGAFGSPNTRQLLANMTTYMILDDHEIEDNWVQGRIRSSAKRELFNIAVQAYKQFQWSHSPRSFNELFYYHFGVGGFPFFVIDGRTQRIRDDDDYNLADNHMLGRPSEGKDYKGQIDLLCDWLVEQQATHGDRPKFIVSASVFVPNDVRTVRSDRHKCENDSWPAFPLTRQQLLHTIVSHGVQNVVFLSGDVHCSNVAEIEFYQGGAKSALKALSVTSSAFFWPYPFADGHPLDFVHDSHREGDNFDIGDGWEMRYTARAFTQEDNFTQVDVDWPAAKLTVTNMNRHGTQIGEAQVLRLAR